MIVTSTTVSVRNLEIHLSIGVHEFEKKAPQRLLISVDLEVDLDRRRAADDIDTAVDYDAVCDFIRSLQNDPHVELQETVAQRVLAFALTLPGVAAATVATQKPDVFDDCDFVGVSISAKKS